MSVSEVDVSLPSSGSEINAGGPSESVEVVSLWTWGCSGSRPFMLSALWYGSVGGDQVLWSADMLLLQRNTFPGQHTDGCRESAGELRLRFTPARFRNRQGGYCGLVVMYLVFGIFSALRDRVKGKCQWYSGVGE